MKKIILSFTLIFAFKLGYSQWNNFSFSGLPVLQDICFVDANTGFVCGDDASNSTQKYARIYRTSNGGTTWTKVFEVTDPPFPAPGTHSLHSIFFTSSSTGWCVGGQDGVYPFVCKTTDGGLTWTSVSLTQFTKVPRNIFFPTPSVGYMCGNNISAVTGLFKTIDGGATWSEISSSANTVMNNCAISDIYFLDNNNGFACTMPSSSQQAGIYKTTNGGTSWTQQYTIGNNEAFHKIQFINSTNGFSVGTTGKAYITTNGGATWTLSTVNSIGSNVYDVYFFTPLLGYATSGDGNFSGGIFKTTNGGTSWTLDNSGNFVVVTTYYSLAFAGGKGYACGFSGYSKLNNAPQGVNEPYEDIFINAFPNPTNGFVTLDIQEDNFNLLLYDMLGNVVASSYNEKTLDLSAQPKGVYFVKIITEDKTYSRKIIIQ